MIVQADTRATALFAWVRRYINASNIVAIPSDASTRRYFRVYKGSDSFIAMDASPRHENNHAFVIIAKAFLDAGLQAPKILQVDFNKGFLLLSDLGDVQLLKILNPKNVHMHYKKAINDLMLIQRCSIVTSGQLPKFDHHLLLIELNRFHEWYLIKHLGLQLSSKEMKMLENIYQLLIDSANEQSQVCVHRDYHSRNLMVLTNDKLGILDFQDAVIGPVTYDLVSLVRDCYIKWPSDEVYQWVEHFWRLLKDESAQVPACLDTFTKWFDWMGLQRHLKVLGIFARLSHRDSKTGYLQDIPRVLDYVLFVCDQYLEFKPLKEFITKRVMFDESNDFSGRTRQSDEATHG